MSIKQQIEALPDTYLDEPVHIEVKQYGTAPETLFTVTQLKALAASHTRLKDELKAAVKEIAEYWGVRPEELTNRAPFEAIEEAEKL